MPVERIEVDAYSGYKVEELPRTLIIKNKKVVVSQILKMWIEERQNDKNRRRYFDVEGSNRYIYRIYFDEMIKGWFLEFSDD